MNKRADIPDWIVPTLYYLFLLVVILGIIWLLTTGKMTLLFKKIMDSVRFF